MTLIITALSDNAVIQVSDRRLTFQNGTLCDDLAIKSICVSCLNARFCISYTGLANLGNIRTDELVFNYLSSINAGNLTFETLFDSFHKFLASKFIKHRNLGRVRAITFVFAGLSRRGPFVGQLSNIEDIKGNRLNDIDDNFQWFFHFRNVGTSKKLGLLIAGNEDPTKAFDAAISKIIKRYNDTNAKRIVAILVQLIRKSADHPKANNNIGRNCLSSIVYPFKGFLCQDHPEKSSPQTHMPHCILQGASYRDIKLWSGGNGPPPWWTG